MTILYVLLALLLLGILVFVHEGGHFLAARMTGIPVREFSIGFGPKITERKSRKYDTNFVIRAIPAGGYCAFYGEDDPDSEKKNDLRCMNRYPVWKRALTVLMGPGMNFILAFVVAFGFYLAAGELTDVQYGRAVIAEVVSGGPAMEAGLQPGDIIQTVNGGAASGIDEAGNSPFSKAISSFREEDGAVRLTVIRGEEEIGFEVIPRYSEDLKGMAIGVTYQTEAEYVYSPVSMGRAARLGFAYCKEAGSAILKALKQLVTTGEGLEDTGGPIRIIQIVSEETREYGSEAYFNLLILISVNLGLMNLLPIPGLDGSRLLFLLYEGIFRRPVNRRLEAYIHLAGFALIMMLFVLLTYRDIIHLFR